MPKVICTLPNASEEISGVRFSPHESGGMVSEEISEEMASHFASVPGYAMHAEQVGLVLEPQEPVAPEAPVAADAQDATKQEPVAPEADVVPAKPGRRAAHKE